MNTMNKWVISVSRFAREAMEKSLPLIRPLWMFNPRDERCQVSIYYLYKYLYTLSISRLSTDTIYRWWVTSSWWGMRSWWRQCSNKVRSLLLLLAKIFFWHIQHSCKNSLCHARCSEPWRVPPRLSWRCRDRVEAWHGRPLLQGIYKYLQISRHIFNI